MQHYRNQRCIIANNLVQHYKDMSTTERKENAAEAKYCQLQIQKAIKDLRYYRATGHIPKPTDEDTDIEQNQSLEDLLRMRSNARTNLSKSRKHANAGKIAKWEKILFRLEDRIQELTQTE